MKKYLLYTFLGAASLMASCTEDFNEDVAAPQQWEQEAAVDAPNVTAQSVGSIDLGTAGDSVTVFSLNVTSIPTGTTIANLRLQSDEASVEIKADNNGKIASADLQALIEKQYGKRPTERTLYAVVHGDCMKDGQASFFNAGQIEIKATPKAPFISTGYYLVGDMFKIDDTNNGWNDVCMQAFNHSGKDVYEDPIFTIVFTTTAENQYWKVIPQSNIDNENFWANPGVVGPATDGESALSATLVNENAQAGKIEKPAMYKMTLNMIEYTYTLEELDYPEFIYEIGNNTEWGSAYALQGPNFDGIYHGAMFLKSGFKFRSNANDWNGSGNWGLDADGTEGKLISDGGSKDIPLAEDGFYKITVDLNKMEYTLTKFEKLGIIGDGQPGGWDTDTELTYDNTEKCWKATGVVLTAGKSIKFRTVGDWNTVNIGGSSISQLIFNSNDNIPVAESGTFTVKLFLETSGQPYATLTKE